MLKRIIGGALLECGEDKYSLANFFLFIQEGNAKNKRKKGFALNY